MASNNTPIKQAVFYMNGRLQVLRMQLESFTYNYQKSVSYIQESLTNAGIGDVEVTSNPFGRNNFEEYPFIRPGVDEFREINPASAFFVSKSIFYITSIGSLQVARINDNLQNVINSLKRALPNFNLTVSEDGVYLFSNNDYRGIAFINPVTGANISYANNTFSAANISYSILKAADLDRSIVLPERVTLPKEQNIEIPNEELKRIDFEENFYNKVIASINWNYVYCAVAGICAMATIYYFKGSIFQAISGVSRRNEIDVVGSEQNAPSGNPVVFHSPGGSGYSIQLSGGVSLSNEVTRFSIGRNVYEVSRAQQAVTTSRGNIQMVSRSEEATTSGQVPLRGAHALSRTQQVQQNHASPISSVEGNRDNGLAFPLAHTPTPAERFDDNYDRSSDLDSEESLGGKQLFPGVTPGPSHKRGGRSVATGKGKKRAVSFAVPSDTPYESDSEEDSGAMQGVTFTNHGSSAETPATIRKRKRENEGERRTSLEPSSATKAFTPSKKQKKDDISDIVSKFRDNGFLHTDDLNKGLKEVCEESLPQGTVSSRLLSYFDDLHHLDTTLNIDGRGGFKAAFDAFKKSSKTDKLKTFKGKINIPQGTNIASITGCKNYQQAYMKYLVLLFKLSLTAEVIAQLTGAQASEIAADFLPEGMDLEAYENFMIAFNQNKTVNATFSAKPKETEELESDYISNVYNHEEKLSASSSSWFSLSSIMGVTKNLVCFSYSIALDSTIYKKSSLITKASTASANKVLCHYILDNVIYKELPTPERITDDAKNIVTHTGCYAFGEYAAVLLPGYGSYAHYGATTACNAMVSATENVVGAMSNLVNGAE